MAKTLTTQTMQACVLDQNGKPLMPTTRLGKVYRLLKHKRPISYHMSHLPSSWIMNLIHGLFNQ